MPSFLTLNPTFFAVIAHAIWSSNGFLSAFAAEEDLFNDVGVVDFAGSGVVHMTGTLLSWLYLLPPNLCISLLQVV